MEPINGLVEWVVRAISLFNTIALCWLGLTVLLNAEHRRRLGTWLAGGGLIAAGLFFAGHTAVVSRAIGTFEVEMEFWWRTSWLVFVSAPYLWYALIAWYTGSLAQRGHRLILAVITLVGLTGLLLLVLGPVPTYDQLRARVTPPATTLGWLALVLPIYPVFSTLCSLLSIVALYRPAGSQRFMGDLARRRARPWLVAATLVLLSISLLTGWVAATLIRAELIEGLSLYSRPLLATIYGYDLLIASLVAVMVILVGQAVVSYEIFTGKTLPRGGLLRQWQASLVLAAGYGAVISASLALAIDPIYHLLLATLVMTGCYALFSWRAYVERERGIDRLRPFVASQHLYERLLEPAAPIEVDASTPFRALCEHVLGARLAYLVAVGPLAPLVGPALVYSPAQPPAEPVALPPPDQLTLLAAQLSSPQTICLPLDPLQHQGAVWAVPLWSERGLIGLLLLGEKRDGGLYTQEELEIARATGERLIDTRASAELAHRLMTMQRQRLAESQVLDRQARRVIHDEVLPNLHAAMLSLNGQTPAAVGLLTDAHRQLANLLQTLPVTVSTDVARLGLLAALRQTVEREFSRDFDGVDWQIEPAAAEVAAALSPLAAEVIFHAAREAIRNASRYGRGGDLRRPLHLTVHAAQTAGLVITITDDGVGLGSERVARAGSGQGLALHGTMMAVIGGTLTLESRPGGSTEVRLAVRLSP